jgi:Spy/CpxP family protein refolding chaperone
MSRLHLFTRKTLLLGCAALLIPGGLLFAGSRHGSASDGDEGDFGGRFHHRGGHGEMMHKVAAKLDLTDEQKSGIREVFKSHRTELRDAMEKVRAARDEQNNAIHGDSFDEAAIRSAAAKLAASEADFAVLRGRVATEVQALLTPEQKIKAKELFSEARSFRKGMFERFHGKRGGEDSSAGDS